MQDQAFHTVTITKIVEINSTVKQFFLQFPFNLQYSSGQFIIIDFETLAENNSTRSYSIADFTNGNTIELCISLKASGAATPLLFQLKAGDTLKASLPQGRFTLPESIDKPEIAFICTGTGVAPFRAMLKDLLFHRNYQGRIHLFFGCRTQSDILYKDEFDQLSKEFKKFSYIPVLSREKWNGAEGYVHAHYQKHFQSKPDAMFYLCGWTAMLKETRDNLKAFGYTRTEIKVEFYD